jgi:hypothetical protein
MDGAQIDLRGGGEPPMTRAGYTARRENAKASLEGSKVMPIKEEDPWRVQYFADVPCPADVVIPTEDGDAYMLYPAHRWIYNKMQICETQGIAHAPHGFPPPRYPVFSKPIYNMRGMATGSRIFRTAADYMNHQEPGHMWMELLVGEQVSTDVAVLAGEPVWWRHTTAVALGDGVFDYWTVLAENRPDLEAYCGDWVRRNLAGYTGMVNLETIGGRIIEAHLRFSDQWPDLYGGRRWVESVIALYAEGRWTFDDGNRRPGYSVVLFGGHGIRYRHPDPAVVREIRERPGVSSVQITFHDDRAPKVHAMPPGGFRLAIVNCWDLEAGSAARELLALAYWSTQTLLRRPRRAAKATVKA